MVRSIDIVVGDDDDDVGRKDLSYTPFVLSIDYLEDGMIEDI